MAGPFVAFALLMGVFWLVGRRFAAHPGQRRTVRDTVTDVAYLVFNPLVGKALTRAAVVVIGALCVTLFVGIDALAEASTAFSSRSPLGRQPVWLQAVEVLLLSDFLGYWIHRAFHGARWWRFHAVHHSSERLDWLSSPRIHPVNDLLGTVLRVVPLFILGFRVELLAAYVPLFLLWGMFLHANVWWRLGPLRFVVSSPAFHRWHHARDEQGRDKNFAGLFPVWDLLFGTYYLPDRPPGRCGIDEPMAPGFLGQLVHPWRKQRVAYRDAAAHR